MPFVPFSNKDSSKGMYFAVRNTFLEFFDEDQVPEVSHVQRRSASAEPSCAERKHRNIANARAQALSLQLTPPFQKCTSAAIAEQSPCDKMQDIGVSQIMHDDAAADLSNAAVVMIRSIACRYQKDVAAILESTGLQSLQESLQGTHTDIHAPSDRSRRASLEAEDVAKCHEISDGLKLGKNNTDFSKEIVITLKKTPEKSRLGMQVDIANSVSLVVTKVSEGLLGEWNRENPEFEVKAGDRIMTVNGHSGDAAELTNVCKHDSVLEMQIVREKHD
jgi:hypothetical protein